MARSSLGSVYENLIASKPDATSLEIRHLRALLGEKAESENVKRKIHKRDKHLSTGMGYHFWWSTKCSRCGGRGMTAREWANVTCKCCWAKKRKAKTHKRVEWLIRPGVGNVLTACGMILRPSRTRRRYNCLRCLAKKPKAKKMSSETIGDCVCVAPFG